jgi:hypothetical protein
MKSEPEELESRMRAATSRHASELDAETATLREGFLILGRRLEDATTVRDELRLLAALRDAHRPEAVSAKKGTDATNHHVLPMLVFLATLAAVMLVSVSIVWNVFQGSLASRDLIAQPTPTRNTEPETEPDSQIAESSSAADEALLAWDDALEETFVSTQWRVRQAGSLASAADTEVESLYDRIQSAVEELDPASL